MMMRDLAEAVGGGSEVRYKGVRRRKWGKWVSEIRLPNSRERIWLGSYDSPEKAARAFDFAAVCLRGRRARLNFPSAPPRVPSSTGSLTHQQIQFAAARHANEPPPPPPAHFSPAPPPAGESPALSSSEVSDGMTTESEEPLDWSFMDLLTAPNVQHGFPTMDEFGYGLFSPVAVPAPDTAEENMPSSSSSFLWNF